MASGESSTVVSAVGDPNPAASTRPKSRRPSVLQTFTTSSPVGIAGGAGRNGNKSAGSSSNKQTFVDGSDHLFMRHTLSWRLPQRARRGRLVGRASHNHECFARN